MSDRMPYRLHRSYASNSIAGFLLNFEVISEEQKRLFKKKDEGGFPYEYSSLMSAADLQVFFNAHNRADYRPKPTERYVRDGETEEAFQARVREYEELSKPIYRVTYMHYNTLYTWETMVKEAWDEVRKKLEELGFQPVDGQLSFG